MATDDKQYLHETCGTCNYYEPEITVCTNPHPDLWYGETLPECKACGLWMRKYDK